MQNRILTLLLLALPTGLAGADEGKLANDLPHRAAQIRPTAAELRWQEIPWQGSLVEAHKVARAEKRLLLVWTLDEDPFERC